MDKLTCFLLFSLFFTFGCTKEKASCAKYTELIDTGHSVDVSVLSQETEILDTLAKYPQLQVVRIINDEYLIGIHCTIFYAGVLRFSDHYILLRSKKTNEMIGLDTIPNNISFSMIPTIKENQARDIARNSIDFSKTCISYRLGIYNVNTGIPNQKKNPKLSWKIQGENGYPYVILDANNGLIYAEEDGKFY